MTFNALMLPAPPPTPRGGLEAAGRAAPTAVKSSRLGESIRGRRSFLDTLNDVSHRRYPSRSESAGKKVAADLSVGSDNMRPGQMKAREATHALPDQAEGKGTKASPAAFPNPDAWHAFGMIQLRFFGFSMADDSSFSDEIRFETTEGSNSVSGNNLMYVQPSGRVSLMDWLAGAGFFEQLQANISPEASNQYLLEQLVARTAVNQGAESMTGAQVELIGFWRWLTSPSEGTLNLPTASMWANGDTLLGAFLHMQQTTAADSGLNSGNIEIAGQNTANYMEPTQLNEDFLVKMTIPSLPGELDSSENPKSAENAKTAGTGKEAPIPFWTTSDPNSEALFETASRPATDNSQLFKIIANAKATDQHSANPNLVAESATPQPADHASSFKSAALNAESLAPAELSSKISRIEGDIKDGGFFFAQDQLPEHLKTLGSVTRTLEGAQRGLASQAMDQIVNKAVLLLNSDQHEVRIELKPEFLGHIRMQIVTENQQVAVKIVAEFPLAKELLESNLNQLKAQLQAQGLAVDELEVSVAHDSYSEADTRQAEKIAKLREARNGIDFDDESSDKLTQSQHKGGGSMAETAIDYFA
jgi:flagellar hook-length control protein FliK